MTATDKIGNILTKGTKIVFAKKNDDQVHFGTVEEVLERNRIKVRRNSTGRVSVNARAGKEVLNIDHLAEVFPEFLV
jgi:hypothetical protein